MKKRRATRTPRYRLTIWRGRHRELARRLTSREMGLVESVLDSFGVVLTGDDLRTLRSKVTDEQGNEIDRRLTLVREDLLGGRA